MKTYDNQPKEKDILQYALQYGMIDLDVIRQQIEMNERKKYLELHPYRIWKGIDDKWHTYLPDKERGRIQKKRNSREEIQEIIIQYWRTEEENPTIEEVFTEWNDKRLELQKISKATHLRNKQCFTRHYDVFGKYRIKFVGEEDFMDFLEQQIPRFHLTSKAFCNLKSITKGFLKRAKKRKLIDFNIESLLFDLDVTNTNFRKVIKEDYEEVFNEEEMKQIIPYLTEHQDSKNLGILLMFVSGLRVGEVVALENTTILDDCIHIRKTETRYYNEQTGTYIYEIKDYPKSDAGVRDVILPENYKWLYEKLRTLNPHGQYVFLSDKGSRMTTYGIRSRLKYICKQKGIYQKSPHKIRKTYGSILLDNNIDSRLIMGQMGHSDIRCTETHYHRNRKSIKQKEQILSNIPDFSAGMSVGYQKASKGIIEKVEKPLI